MSKKTKKKIKRLVYHWADNSFANIYASYREQLIRDLYRLFKKERS